MICEYDKLNNIFVISDFHASWEDLQNGILLYNREELFKLKKSIDKALEEQLKNNQTR